MQSNHTFFIIITVTLCTISCVFFITSPIKHIRKNRESECCMGLLFLFMAIAFLSTLFDTIIIKAICTNIFFLLAIYSLYFALELRLDTCHAKRVFSIAGINCLIIGLLTWATLNQSELLHALLTMIVDINLAVILFLCFIQLQKEKDKGKLNNISKASLLASIFVISVAWLPLYLSTDPNVHIKSIFMAQTIVIFILFGGLLSLLLTDVIYYHHQNSITDNLTGLYNRHFFSENCKLISIDAKRHNYPVSCIICDIDNFKRINDEYGHDVGDRVLIHFSKCLNGVIRNSDFVARIGGEEFVAILKHTDLESAQQTAERMRSKIENSFILHENKKITFTASFGVSQLIDACCGDMLKNADKALYCAKHNGKNLVSCFHN